MQLALVILAFVATALAVVFVRVAAIARERATHAGAVAPAAPGRAGAVLAAPLLAAALVAPLLAAGVGPAWLVPAFELALGGAGLLFCAWRGLERPAWPFGLALLLGALAFAAREEAVLEPARSGLALYLLAAAPLLAAPAWPRARRSLPQTLEAGEAPAESFWLACGGLALLGAVSAYVSWRSGFDAGLAAALLALSLFAVFAGLLRPGLAPLGALQAGIAAAAIALAPKLAPLALGAAGLLGLMAVLGGALWLRRRADAWSGAALAAFGPLAALAAAAPWLAPGPQLAWAGAALALAAAGLLAFLRSGRDARRDLFGLAGALALLLTLLLAGAQAFALPAALASLGLALLAGRAGSRSLALCAAGFGGWAAVAAMGALTSAAAGWPSLALAAFDAAAAALALWLARGRLAGAGELPGGAVLETALALAAVSAGLVGANLAAGLLGAGPLAVTGAHALTLLGAAFLLGRARGLAPTVRGRLEAGFLGAAAVYALLAGVSVFNPWWGMSPAAAPGWPLLNPLVAAYALPALGFALFARLRRGPEAAALRQGALFSSSALFALWGLLEARRWLSGADLTLLAAPPSQLAWAGAVGSALLALGLAALSLGLRRGAPRPQLLGAAGPRLPARLGPLPWARAPKGDPNLAPPL